MIKRTIKCAACGKEYTEANPGDGFPGWTSYNGIVLNGEANPDFCPDDTHNIANFIDGYCSRGDKS